MKRKTVIFGSIILVIILAGVFGLFFSNGKTAEASYRTAKLERGDLDVLVTATGALGAVKTVEVGTQVSGIISKLYVDFNSVVKKNQIVAMIDTTFLAASAKDAEANVERARALANQSQRDLARMKPMFEKGLASQSDLDNIQSTYEQAVASLKSAKAQYDRAMINLHYATIRAPIDGVVIDRKVDVGQTVAASLSAPTIYTIANDLTKMQVLATIDEADIGQVKDDQDVSFSVDAYPERVFHGKVAQIRLQPQTISNVVNYTVVINVPNPDLKLMPGMTATVNILVAHKEGVLKVPNVALRFQPTAEEKKTVLDEMQKEFGNRDTTATGNPQQDSLRAMFRQRASAAGGGGSGKVGQGGSSTSRGQLWYFDEKKNLKVAYVRTGVTNGTYTEINVGQRTPLKEGTDIIVGLNLQAASKQVGSPLSGQSQQRSQGMRGF
ncbi:MAG: efflux RND transporter periplasmic adaptor subunit [Bacteroidota bacterium]